MFAGDKGQRAFRLIVAHAFNSHRVCKVCKAAAHLLKCQRTNGWLREFKLKKKNLVGELQTGTLF